MTPLFTVMMDTYAFGVWNGGNVVTIQEAPKNIVDDIVHISFVFFRSKHVLEVQIGPLSSLRALK